VEKHTYRCNSRSYSCIDCQVCFTFVNIVVVSIHVLSAIEPLFTREHFLLPTNYKDHVKCISENQKYGSKNYIEKEAKGELKQNAWCEQVERAIEFVKEPKLKSLLQNIQGYSNIPRKEAKFINFLTNSCRIRDVALCKLAWKAIADEAEKLKKEEEARKAKEEEKEEQQPVSESGKKDENGNEKANGSEVNFRLLCSYQYMF
ncbi:LYAR-type C2HC zinc finger, partial [Oesophagostomum dentatum]